MLFRWYRRRLASMLRRTQAEVRLRFPADEAQRRNAALQRMIDVLERP
jgi:hypothetical protein